MTDPTADPGVPGPGVHAPHFMDHLDERLDRVGVDRLCAGVPGSPSTEEIQAAGIKAEAIHGDKSQQERLATLEGFKKGEILVLPDSRGGQVIVRDAQSGVYIAGSEPRNDGAAVGF